MDGVVPAQRSDDVHVLAVYYLSSSGVRRYIRTIGIDRARTAIDDRVERNG
jgi:hypothetical protein